MSSSSTKNVHLKGEKGKVPLRKITSQSSKAKYNAPVEGRKSLENVASTHRTNNLRNSLSSSEVPIRLESRTGGCSKSNSEVMINENSNKSKGNSKRKIIDHLNSRESHPHGEDKVNAHLSGKKPSKLKGNSAFQINITENISHPRHSRSSSSKEGNEHMKRHGQGRIEPKKMLPCKSILKKFSQSDLHLNKPNLYSAKRKTNFDIWNVANQSEKQSNLRKVSFKTFSTNDLTRRSNDSKESFILRKREEGKLVKHVSSNQRLQSGDHLVEKKPCKLIPDNLKKQSPTGESIRNSSINVSEVLSAELRSSNVKENETILNKFEDNKNPINESNFDITTMETNSEKPDDIKLPSGNSLDIEEISISKTDLLHAENKYHSESSGQREVFEKEINDKIKFSTEQHKKNINFNQRPISVTDNKDCQRMAECRDYKIDQHQMNSSSTAEFSNNTVYGSNVNTDELKIEDNYNAKKLRRKQLLEKEINDKIKRLTTKFRENQSKRSLPDIVANKEENLKLTEIKWNEDKLIILNPAPCSNDVKLNGCQKIIIDDSKNKIKEEIPSNLSCLDYFNKHSVNFNSKEYDNSQTDLKSISSKSPTPADKIGPTKFSRIPRPLNSKCLNLKKQSNAGTFEKMANNIFSVFSKQNETGNEDKNISKTVFDENAEFYRKSPFTCSGSKVLTKSPRFSKIPRSLRSKSVTDSPLSGDFRNGTFRKRTKSTSSTNDVLDGSKAKLFSYVKEHGSGDENAGNENELHNLNERSFSIEEFDSLVQNRGDKEHFDNSKFNHFEKIALNDVQRKTINMKEETNERDMLLSKKEDNSTNYCNENYSEALQVGRCFYPTKASISDVVYSFYRHSKMLFLLGFIVLCFVLFLELLFEA